jgi:hypothetical protein
MMNIEFAPISDNEMSYGEAILYCQFLECNGHKDWRLPTRPEWHKNLDVLLSSWYGSELQVPSSVKNYATAVRNV